MTYKMEWAARGSKHISILHRCSWPNIPGGVFAAVPLTAYIFRALEKSEKSSVFYHTEVNCGCHQSTHIRDRGCRHTTSKPHSFSLTRAPSRSLSICAVVRLACAACRSGLSFFWQRAPTLTVFYVIRIPLFWSYILAQNVYTQIRSEACAKIKIHRSGWCVWVCYSRIAAFSHSLLFQQLARFIVVSPMFKHFVRLCERCLEQRLFA